MGGVTIPGVELCRVGNWASALSGRVSMTGSDLDAMVAASRDAEVDQVAVRIGHVDPRFDGEPALGWVANVRRAGDVLLGDLVDVPERMAELARSAFRRRSAEIAWGVRTPGGRQYKAALSGLALLGVTAPAVKGLADVLTHYSGQVEADGFSTVEVTTLSSPPPVPEEPDDFFAGTLLGSRRPTVPAVSPEDAAWDDFFAGTGLDARRSEYPHR
jgi:hypothetical protein